MTDHWVHGDEVSGHNAGEGLHGNLVTAFFREHIHLKPRDENVRVRTIRLGLRTENTNSLLGKKGHVLHQVAMLSVNSKIYRILHGVCGDNLRIVSICESRCAIGNEGNVHIPLRYLMLATRPPDAAEAHFGFTMLVVLEKSRP